MQFASCKGAKKSCDHLQFSNPHYNSPGKTQYNSRQGQNSIYCYSPETSCEREEAALPACPAPVLGLPNLGHKLQPDRKMCKCLDTPA